jgi:hypothetical protein
MHTQANKYEKILHQRADGISQNLHRALASHRRLVTDDVMAALIEHVRSSVMYEKQLLRELEALRPDINNAASNAPVPTAVNGAPRPTVVPALEDYSTQRTRAQPPAPLPGPSRGPLLAHGAPLPPTPVSAGIPGVPSAPQSPAFGSSARPPQAAVPPLGGRFSDGSQSMFITPSPRAPLPAATVACTSTMPPLPPQAGPLAPSDPSGRPPLDPLATPAADPLSSSFAGPLSSQTASPVSGAATPISPVDPLGGLKPGNLSGSLMAGSIRMSHHRSRLDAREAASKLANAF